MKPNKAVVYMVVGSLAYVLVMYATTLAIAAFTERQVSEVILTHFKELAFFAGGAVAGLLARTSNSPDSTEPTKTEATIVGQTKTLETKDVK